MTTARDLMIVAIDMTAARPVGQGDLSLALAGAEALDLVEAGALAVDGGLLVPGPPSAPHDPLLEDAASALLREPPYESVEDWLWRRGRGLAAAYTARLETDGVLGRPRRLIGARTAPVDSPARSGATGRWASQEPVLAALAAAVGLREEPADGLPDTLGEAVVTVVSTVADAVTELEAVRQRRSIENAAFDNIWRAP
ncbi:GPP34 family phosphoprotein [Streptomyces sp. ME08-AFT2]|uniref:GOLPH3/VPS74 family protein n=1 Tax=Streptomyces sp. ME08-AFT2 TaxID=3028683 RepID=UPI0029B8C0C0|nr:GPP34 family phosphoprotein [Streptomyces sp. ME08-AFT2]MDX3313326.1 GPP34 family phosphoprotein [Streptomyces sp. ME08-AFT2]